MEKSIKERAKLYAEKRFAETITIPEEEISERLKARIIHGHKMVYTKIATEQKAIDDKRIAELEKEKASLVLEIHNKNKRIAELLAR